MTAPVFALAFANDQDPSGRPLPGLAEERAGLVKTLGAPDAAWRMDEKPNASLDDLLDLFDTHAGRVVALHYGGHAAGSGLLLETHEGHLRLAGAGGLARFLGAQPGLRFVCLNGCSTAPQVQGLLAAGVPAVIATDCAVEDASAVQFATRFYHAIANGHPLRTAFDAAVGAVSAAGVAGPARGMDTISAAEAAPNASVTVPWRLHVRDGAASVMDWHIGLDTGDPLFGLPLLPNAPLPNAPFRNLRWFGPEHAALFFGRGIEIRSLYERVTGAGRPILLLHGQAGAGKSSLLAAGVGPRLAATHQVAYVRRDDALGLAGTLRTALGAPADVPLAADAWRDGATR